MAVLSVGLTGVTKALDWSTAQPIVSGLGPDSRSNSLDIDIAVDSEGAWHVVYFERGNDGEDATYDILYANSQSEQAVLDHVVLQPGVNGATIGGPTIATGPDGSCHAAYRVIEFSNNVVTGNHILYTNNSSGSWSTPQPIVSGLDPDSRSNAFDIDIAVDSDGTWHLVYLEYSENVPESDDRTFDILYANSNSETATLAHTAMHPGANGATAEGPTIAIGPDGSCHVAYRHIDFVSNDVVNNYIMYKHRVSPFPDALVLEPDPVLAIMTNAIDPTTGAIFIGDEFDIGYNAADINITGLLINNTIPVTAAILTTHPLIEGEALAVSFPLDVFADGYGLIWDSTIQTYQVTGEFNDATPFSTGDEFFFLGRISGDLTLDGRIDISDVVLMVEWFFGGGAPPGVVETADVNASGGTDISDLLYLVDYIFNQGPAPQHP